MKPSVIAIQPEPSCFDPTPARPAIALTRRQLLKGAGILTGVLATSSALAVLAPSRAWALELNTLDSHQGAVILEYTKHLYPHRGLEDAVYALVVKSLDKKAKTDRDAQQTLVNGVARLDQIDGHDWLKRAKDLQLVDVTSMEGDPFFNLVRSTAVVALYSNDMAYAHFGYQGEQGDAGYLHSGFNDLAWLPDPPAQASGPLPKDA